MSKMREEVYLQCCITDTSIILSPGPCTLMSRYSPPPRGLAQSLDITPFILPAITYTFEPWVVHLVLRKENVSFYIEQPIVPLANTSTRRVL